MNLNDILNWRNKILSYLCLDQNNLFFLLTGHNLVCSVLPVSGFLVLNKWFVYLIRTQETLRKNDNSAKSAEPFSWYWLFIKVRYDNLGYNIRLPEFLPFHKIKQAKIVKYDIVERVLDLNQVLARNSFFFNSLWYHGSHN